MPLGFGIIGCGMIAQFHARAIQEISGIRLVGCCSRNPDTAQRFADEWSVTPYQTLAELLQDPKLDVVCICSPSGAHAEPAIAAARAGKHVVVEKPLEINMKRCDRIIKACEVNGVVLSVIFPSRFHSASQLVKQAIDSGKFGRLTLGDAFVKWYRTQEYYDSGNWRGTWDLDGGGALMNQAIHNVDLLTWLMGPVAEISANTATLGHKRIEVEDVATASLRFANGALGTIVATTAAWPGWLKKIEIHGTEGSAAIEEEDVKVWQFNKMTPRDRKVVSRYSSRTTSGGGAADPAAIGHAAHTKQIRDVVKAIKSGGRPLIDGTEGRRSVEIIRAIYKSAKSGRSVALPLKSDR